MIFDHARRLSGRRSAAFGDHEDDVPIILMLAHDLIARFANEIGNVDARQRIGAAHLQVLANGDADADSPGGGNLAGTTLEQIEKRAIRETLRLTAGNREHAAKLLGIGERTLYRKLKEYGLR